MLIINLNYIIYAARVLRGDNFNDKRLTKIEILVLFIYLSQSVYVKVVFHSDLKLIIFCFHH